MIPSLVRTAYGEYLDYIQTNPRLHIPDSVHDPSKSIGKVHASAIGRCPKKSALSRSSDVETLFNLSTRHLMEQGKRDAEPIQEAMWWKYPIEVQVEFSVEKPPFRGRFDILYNETIIELKRRDGYMGKDGVERSPTPYLTDLYQIICYSYMTGFDNIWLCLFTRRNLFFYELRSDMGGFVLYDENGQRWKSEFNNPSYLNYDVILAEANTHQQYLNGERSDDPLPFYLNYRGYECGNWVNNVKPKQYKYPVNGKSQNEAYFKPTCPFFADCKGVKINNDGLVKVEEIEYDSKKFSIAEA